ncbi:MAG: APC family permease [Actinobacteria bacterium]|nr:MAG: APC family permease [Actinomycetota bacterium]
MSKPAETEAETGRFRPPPAEGIETIKRALVGQPMRTDAMEETLLRKRLALPIFASDPFSSVAYATEAALIVLVGASLTSLHLVLPISAAISVLLAIVIASYRQTVRAYSTSGGSYVVARDNLGTIPSLVAAAALLTDYVLTVAVSVAAGVLAIVSAVPSIGHLSLELSIGAVVLITLVNLRGVRESGIAFAIPTYAFISAYIVLIAVGGVKCGIGTCPHAVAPHPLPAGAGAGAVTLFVLLRAFASGSAALTGVEAISNGVSAFRHPQAKNAAKTLFALGVIAITFFLGVSWLTVRMHARPSETASVVSQLARATFPTGTAFGFMFWVVQITTFAILVLAANTSFQGFPRLGALLARDRFFPRQFANLGDRLVYSNGIIVLSGLAIFLLWHYDAKVDSLIHLYVIGVFTAFTLSQAGMVRYWLRTQSGRWRRSMAVNGLGAFATGVVSVIVIWTKFAQGAWLVTVAIPVMVVLFLAIHRHYRKTARRLRAAGAAVAAAPPAHTTIVVTVDAIDAATERAVWYAREVGDTFHPVHVPGRHTDPGINARWHKWVDAEPRLERLSPDEGQVDAVLEYVWRLPRGDSEFVNVVVPELFKHRSLLEAVRRTKSFAIKLRLLREPGVVITDVPLVAGDAPTGERLVARILVSGIHGASLRAINYARTLRVDDVRAVFFAFDSAEARRIRDDWQRQEIEVPLEVVEAPFRDLGDPLREYLRSLTGDGTTLVSVVMPELVVSGWRRLLHNQRALYLKRLLLFEPRVILSSVPYQLR